MERRLEKIEERLLAIEKRLGTHSGVEESDDEEEPPMQVSSSDLSTESRAALGRQDFEKALSLATAALEKNPNSVRALRVKGESLVALQREWPSARDAFSLAQEIDYDPEIQILLQAAIVKCKEDKDKQEPASAPGGVPNIAEMLNHPEFMDNLQQVMANPGAMEAIMKTMGNVRL
tara:strand:+ start:528 stop:1055 length:528 start_codon:yes stop_codon:yes gene_type:complete